MPGNQWCTSGLNRKPGWPLQTRDISTKEEKQLAQFHGANQNFNFLCKQLY
jgi:hypothetical protein